VCSLSLSLAAAAPRTRAFLRLTIKEHTTILLRWFSKSLSDGVAYPGYPGGGGMLCRCSSCDLTTSATRCAS
jgi:hypothetical protein